MSKTLKIIILIALVLFLTNASAQCAMCRAVLESDADHSMAEGVNDGIVYLMAIPYILVAGIALLLYRKFSKS